MAPGKESVTGPAGSCRPEDTGERRGVRSLKNELGICQWARVKREKRFLAGTA